MRPPSKSTHKSILAIAGITLLAPFAGGSYYLWGQACLIAAVGFLLLVNPPRRPPDKWLAMGSVLLLLLALTSYLPASLFPQPPWRKILVEQLLVPLSPTRSAQPWMTFEAIVLLAAAMTWAWHLFSTDFSARDRHTLVSIYCGGIAILTGIALFAYFTGTHVPLWVNARNFGPFPSRNQTGNLLALAGIMIEALALRDLAQRRPRAVAWLAALAVVVTGLVVNYSRAGIGIFFVGSLLWLPFSFHRAALSKMTSIALAAMVILLSFFLLFGGDTLKRFDELSDALPKDARWTIYQDAMKMAADAPLLGDGLGNFEPIFAMKRSFWQQDDHLLHPESDWFWAVIEWGVPATILLALILVFALGKAFPLEAGEDGEIRAAALICCLAFIVHCLIDVSTHRPGSLWPALLLLGVSRRSGSEVRQSPWVPPVFRIAGLAFVGIGGCWLAAYQNVRVIPNSYTVLAINRQIEQALAQEDHPTVLRLSSENLKIRPLDYWLYLRRARARLLGNKDRAGAARDFQTARLLEPTYTGVYMDEGDAWLDANEPERAIAAYSAAFRRHPERAAHHYRGLLNWIQPGLDGREVVRALAQTDQSLWFLFLQSSDASEAEVEIDRVLLADPALQKFTPAQQAEFFSRWWASGEKDQLAQLVIEHPALLSAGWKHLANWYAEKRQFQAAYELARRHHPAPILPPVSPRPIADLLKDLTRNKSDIAAGYALYHAQRAANDLDAALATVGQLTELKDCPAYIYYLQAEMWAEQGSWEKAWQTWIKFQKP